MSASPGARGRGTPVPAARMERTSVARNRPNSTARSMAARKAARVVGRLHGAQLGEVGGQGGHASGGRPLDEGLGHRAEGAERLLGWGLGPHRPSGVRTRPAVVVVTDSRLTRGDEVMARR